MAAPTLVAYTETIASVATGVNVTTASVTWQANDVVIAVIGTEGAPGGGTLNAPTTTGTGISFGAAKQIHQSTGSDCGGSVWAAVASGGSSGTFSVNETHTNAQNLAIGVYVWRGSAGIGNSNIYTGAAPLGLSLTLTGAHGAVAWGVFDWAAAAVEAFSPAATTHTSGSPGPVASPSSGLLSGKFTYYIGDLDDQASAGAVSYGIGGTGTGLFTAVAIEAKASAGGTDATAPATLYAAVAAVPAPVVQQVSGPNYAATATDLGGGSGSWANVTNAQGGDDGTVAVWTVP